MRGGSCRPQAALDLTVDQPVQELRLARHAPVVGFATLHVSLQVRKAAHIGRFETGDPMQALDFASSEPNAGTEAQHGDAGLVVPTSSRNAARSAWFVNPATKKFVG